MELLESIKEFILKVQSFVPSLYSVYSFLSFEIVQRYAFYALSEGGKGGVSFHLPFFVVKENTFFLGLLNSFFFALPFSVGHFVLLKRLFFDSDKVGFVSILGLVFGLITFHGSVLLGLRTIIIPWIGLGPLPFLLFLFLLFLFCFELYPYSKKVFKRTEKENFVFLFKKFLYIFSFAWLEGSCAFRYINNFNFSPTIFAFSTKGSLFLDLLYLFSLLVGTLCLTFLFSFCVVYLKEKGLQRLERSSLKRYKGNPGQIYKELREGFYIFSLVIPLYLLPFYSFDYLLKAPFTLQNPSPSLEGSSMHVNATLPKQFTTQGNFITYSFVRGMPNIKKRVQGERAFDAFNQKRFNFFRSFERTSVLPTNRFPRFHSQKRYSRFKKGELIATAIQDTKEGIGKKKEEGSGKNKKKLKERVEDKERVEIAALNQRKHDDFEVWYKTERRKEKKKIVESVLTGAEQRKRKRKEQVEGKVRVFTKGERVIHRLSNKGREKRGTGPLLEKGFYSVNGTFLKHQKNQGVERQGFSKVRRDLEKRLRRKTLSHHLFLSKLKNFGYKEEKKVVKETGTKKSKLWMALPPFTLVLSHFFFDKFYESNTKMYTTFLNEEKEKQEKQEIKNRIQYIKDRVMFQRKQEREEKRNVGIVVYKREEFVKEKLEMAPFLLNRYRCNPARAISDPTYKHSLIVQEKIQKNIQARREALQKIVEEGDDLLNQTRFFRSGFLPPSHPYYCPPHLNLALSFFNQKNWDRSEELGFKFTENVYKHLERFLPLRMQKRWVIDPRKVPKSSMPPDYNSNKLLIVISRKGPSRPFHEEYVREAPQREAPGRKEYLRVQQLPLPPKEYKEYKKLKVNRKATKRIARMKARKIYRKKAHLSTILTTACVTAFVPFAKRYIEKKMTDHKEEKKERFSKKYVEEKKALNWILLDRLTNRRRKKSPFFQSVYLLKMYDAAMKGSCLQIKDLDSKEVLAQKEFEETEPAVHTSLQGHYPDEGISSFTFVQKRAVIFSKKLEKNEEGYKGYKNRLSKEQIRKKRYVTSRFVTGKEAYINKRGRNSFILEREHASAYAGKRIQNTNRFNNKILERLTRFRIDCFLLNVPDAQKVTVSEEKDLFRKRVMLKRYYDTLRLYKDLPYLKELKEHTRANLYKEEQNSSAHQKYKRFCQPLFSANNKGKVTEEEKARCFHLYFQRAQRPWYGFQESVQKKKKKYRGVSSISKNNGDKLFSHQFFGSRVDNRNKFVSQFSTKEKRSPRVELFKGKKESLSFLLTDKTTKDIDEPTKEDDEQIRKKKNYTFYQRFLDFSYSVQAKKTRELKPVLKFDQPLFLKKGEKDYKLLHEELSYKKEKNKGNEGYEGNEEDSVFLKESTTTPFYRFWSEEAGKVVVSNKMLSQRQTRFATVKKGLREGLGELRKDLSEKRERGDTKERILENFFLEEKLLSEEKDWENRSPIQHILRFHKYKGALTKERFLFTQQENNKENKGNKE